MILECRVKQKQIAPNNLLANNFHQFKLLAHVSLLLCDPHQYLLVMPLQLQSRGCFLLCGLC